MTQQLALKPLGGGVYVFADSLVNVYVIDEGGALTVIDAGMPRLHDAFIHALAGINRSMADIAAILITHGHPDHIGMAQRLSAESAARVWVHADDEQLLTDPRRIRANSPAEAAILPYFLRRPAAFGVPWHLLRTGGFTPTPVTGPSVFRGGETLDVPGSPTVIATPGHTRGSSCFLLGAAGMIATGDTLVTHDGMTGRTGPRLASSAFSRDSRQAGESLTPLLNLDAGIVLPGHGQPADTGIAHAVAQARAAGAS